MRGKHSLTKQKSCESESRSATRAMVFGTRRRRGRPPKQRGKE